MPTAGTPAIAAYLEHPAPDRARSVPLRAGGLISIAEFQQAGRLLAMTAGTAILPPKIQIPENNPCALQKNSFGRFHLLIKHAFSMTSGTEFALN